MKYKLIAVDMDGTLLNSEKRISDQNLQAINEAIRNGVKFVITSGRIPTTLKIYSTMFCVQQPIICCDGGYIVNEFGEVIYSKVFDKELSLKIIDILREESDPYYHIYDGNVILGERFDYNIARFYEMNRAIAPQFRVEIRLLPDSRKYVIDSSKSLRKFVVMDNDMEKLKRIRGVFEKVEDIEVVKSEWNNVNLLPKGVDKGSALKHICEYYGISIDECISIGNDENDITMIKTAGLGVAVNNASDEIKQIAGYVTTNDNDKHAIMEVIKKFILY